MNGEQYGLGLCMMTSAFYIYLKYKTVMVLKILKISLVFAGKKNSF